MDFESQQNVLVVPADLRRMLLVSSRSLLSLLSCTNLLSRACSTSAISASFCTHTWPATCRLDTGCQPCTHTQLPTSVYMNYYVYAHVTHWHSVFQCIFSLWHLTVLCVCILTHLCVMVTHTVCFSALSLFGILLCYVYVYSRTCV